MAKFILRWLTKEPEIVEGSTVSDACRKAGIDMGALQHLTCYEVVSEGKKVQVAGTADCGCVYHAEDGLACEHDLLKVGFSEMVKMEVVDFYEVRKGEVLKGFRVEVRIACRNGRNLLLSIPTDTNFHVKPERIEGIRKENGIELPNPLFS